MAGASAKAGGAGSEAEDSEGGGAGAAGGANANAGAGAAGGAAGGKGYMNQLMSSMVPYYPAGGQMPSMQVMPPLLMPDSVNNMNAGMLGAGGPGAGMLGAGGPGAGAGAGGKSYGSRAGGNGNGLNMNMNAMMNMNSNGMGGPINGGNLIQLGSQVVDFVPMAPAGMNGLGGGKNGMEQWPA